MTRKVIKNVNIRLLPPNGEVMVSVPWSMGDDEIFALIQSKAAWIAAARQRLAAAPQSMPPRLESGEAIRYLGELRTLRIAEGWGGVSVQHPGFFDLLVPNGSAFLQRSAILNDVLARHLAQLLRERVAHWEPQLGVEVSAWTIRRMRTRWGSCNIRARRITFNFALIHESPDSIDYVVAHELTHLHERRHDARFYGLLDQHLPGWREIEARLQKR